MYPTVHLFGDSLLISKFHKYGRGIGVGDVVIYKHPWILMTPAAKRVIGMPGDYVLKNGPIDGKDAFVPEGVEEEMVQVRPTV